MSAPTVSIDQISKFSPLNGLRRESLTQVHGRIRAREFKPGQDIFKIGDREDRAFFLVSGDLDLLDESGKSLRTIRGGSADAQHRLAHQIPRRVTARAQTGVLVFDLDNQLLDVMLTWDQTGAFEVSELSTQGRRSEESLGDGDWMSALLQLELFQQIPPANLQALMMRLEQVPVSAGQIVVKQDDPGDYFYVISSGKAIVTRSSGAHAKPVKLAELGPGACFGEEALITETKRNATVQMLGAGSVLRLSKADFQANLGDKVMRQIGLADARSAVEAGKAQWLDVRLPSEFRQGALPGALSLPLLMLRARLNTLDRDKEWICVCDSGRRSSVAAFVLQQAGLRSAVLRGGYQPG